MSRASTSMGAPTSAGRTTKRNPVLREVGGQNAPDASHSKPDFLLSSYWEFIKLPFAAAAAMLVSTLGADKAEPQTNGELNEAVVAAGNLQKAHGRNIKREIVAQDLGISVPEGFTPTFDLYLQASKIRPDDNDTRAAAREVLTAIRKKMRKVIAGDDQPPNVPTG